MTDYTFFTSYAARRGDRDLVATFHEDLQKELLVKMDRDPEPRGFLATWDIGLGTDWEAELRDAVRTAAVMVALLSDDYLRSGWCGWEWAVFTERIRRASSAATTTGGGRAPVGILPVRWLEIRTAIPAAVDRIQTTTLALGAAYADTCLVDLMRQQPKEYRDFVIRLAEEVRCAATAGGLPILAAAEAAPVAPAFGDFAAPAEPDQSQPTQQPRTMSPTPVGPGSPAGPGGPRIPPSAGPVPGVRGAGREADTRGRITLEEIIKLAEWLESLDFMADPTSRRQWFALVEEQFGQPIRLAETPYLRAFMVNLLRFTAKQSTPAVLVAIADAAGALGPGDPNVERIRAAVEVLWTRW